MRSENTNNSVRRTRLHLLLVLSPPRRLHIPLPQRAHPAPPAQALVPPLVQPRLLAISAIERPAERAEKVPRHLEAELRDGVERRRERGAQGREVAMACAFRSTRESARVLDEPREKEKDKRTHPPRRA